MLEFSLVHGVAGMDLSPPKTKAARFGLFEADFEQRILTKGGLRVRLQEQPFQVLVLLLERPGQVVTREEIRQKLWAADTFVEFDDGLNTAIKKLRTALGDSADNPRFVETIPRRGYRFLAPVTFPVQVESAPDPAFPPKDVVIAAREHSRVVIESTDSRHKLQWAGIVLVAILAAAGGFYYRARHASKSLSPSSRNETDVAVRPRRSVAVLGFRNLSGKPQEDWLSVAISEMLSTELAAGGTLRIVSGEDISRIKAEMPLGSADRLAKDSLAGLRTNLGTDVVVLGSYTVLREHQAEHIRLDLRLQDTGSGDTIADQAVTGRNEDLFELISTAGARLRQQLALGEISAQQAVEVRASLPTSPEAARLYSEGLAKLRWFDGMAARELFLQCIALDPKFARAHSALAQAWSMLGYDQKAKDESKKAFELSTNLSRPDRMWIEGAYREANFEWDKAVEIYKTLYEFFPDNLDYGLRLADAERGNGKPGEALALLENLHKLPPPSGRDPRIDLSAVRTCIRSGDLKKAQNIVESSVEEAKARGSRLLLAQALYLESSTLLNVGDMEKAIGFAEQARQIYHDAGDKFGEAAALAEVGTGLWYKSDITKAIEVYRQCLDMNREIGNQTGAANALNYIGSGRAYQSDLEGARSAFQKALGIYSEVNSQRDVASTLALLAWVQSSEGDLQDARATYLKALAIYREFQDKQSVANTLAPLGEVLAAQGHLAEADKMEREALQIADESGDKVTMASANRNLGMIAVFRGDVESANKWLNTASALNKETGNTSKELEIQHWKSWIDVIEGKLGPAETSESAVASQFHNLNDVPNEIQSGALLVKILVSEKKNKEAQKELSAIQTVAAKAQCFEELLELRIADDQVKAAMGKADEARHDLEVSEALATKKGLALESLEAKLALGQTELLSVSPGAGNNRLARVETEAQAKDFGIIARRAAAAREQAIQKH